MPDKQLEISNCTARIMSLPEFQDAGFEAKRLDVFTKLLENQKNLRSAEQLGKEATRLALEQRRQALIKKQGLVSQAQHVAEKLHYINTFWKDAPGFGLEAKQVGVNSAIAEARESTGAHQRALKVAWGMGWRYDIESISHVKSGVQVNVWKEFGSGRLDSDIFEAMFRLGRDIPDEVTGLDELAVKISRKLMDWNRRVFDAKNNIPGVSIRDLFGYVTRNNSDMHRTRLAIETLRESRLATRVGRAVTGQIEQNPKSNFAAWADYVLPRLNSERTFGEGLDEKGIDEFLRSVWKTYSSGGHLSYLAESATRNIADKMNESRVLHWRDGRAAEEYSRIFSGGNLRSSFFIGLEQNAGAVQLMREWGPNPRAAFNQVLDALVAEHTTQGLGGKKSSLGSMGVERLENNFNVIDGAVNVPGNAMWAEVAASIRAIQTMAKLGNAGLSAVADPVFMASTYRFLGKGVFQSQWDTLSRIMGDDFSPEFRERAIRAIAIMNDSQRGQALAGANVDAVPGVMARGMEILFNLNGLNALTNRFRTAMSLGLASDLGFFVGKSFDGLTPEYKRSLSQNGIGADVWNEVISKAKISEGEHVLIVPEAIRSLDDAPFRKLASKRLAAVASAFDKKMAQAKTLEDVEALKKARANRERRVIREERDKVELKLRGWFTDLVDQSVVTPDARTRSILTQGTKPGTAKGEFVRFIGQFKSFPMAVYQQVLGRELFGRGDDVAGLFYSKMSLRNGGFNAITYNMITSAFYGYVAMSLKDMTKGRTPRNPAESSKSVLAAAMLQGGGAGIFGDFMFGEMRDRYGRSALTALLGPTAGSIEDVADLTGRFFAGDDFAAKAFSDLIQTAPFLNIFYIRSTLDYLIMYNLREMMNPGFLRRMERRIERENAQKFFLPPSSYIPKGGTNPLEVPGELVEEVLE